MNGFKLVRAKSGLEYWHYQYDGVHVHIFGKNEHIEWLARTGKAGVFEFEVEQKTSPRGTICHLNLTLVDPQTPVTHTVTIVGKGREKEHQCYFTTTDMHGVGIGVNRI